MRLTLATLVATALIGTVTPSAHAEPTTSYPMTPVLSCGALWMHDHTAADEDRCREKGWHIGWRYNLSPNYERIWTGVGPCDGEDSRGERGCYWDASRRGNHYGESFVYLRHLGYFYVNRINGRDVRTNK